MEIKRYLTNERMSRVVSYNGILYLCGHVASPGLLTMTEQIKDILSRIEKVLEEHSSDKNHILSAMIHIRDMKLLQEMNTIWDTWIGKGNAPARTCVEAKMTSESTLVEVTIIAVQK